MGYGSDRTQNIQFCVVFTLILHEQQAAHSGGSVRVAQTSADHAM